MNELLRIVTLPIIISIVVCALAHPWLVRIALLKDIVDRPNARKLNSRPIPVLGGVGVFLGLIFTRSTPLTTTEPELGNSSRIRVFRKVLLPAPDAPKR